MQDSFAMERVRRLSRRPHRICGWAIPVILLAPPLWWGLIDTPTAYTELPGGGIPYPEVLTPRPRAAAAVVTLIPAGVMVWLLVQLRRLFDGFARRDVFRPESSSRVLKNRWHGWYRHNSISVVACC